MAKTKKELENELDKIEAKLNTLVKDFAGIRKNMKAVQKQIRTKQDNKKILDLQNKIASF